MIACLFLSPSVAHRLGLSGLFVLYMIILFLPMNHAELLIKLQADRQALASAERALKIQGLDEYAVDSIRWHYDHCQSEIECTLRELEKTASR